MFKVNIEGKEFLLSKKTRVCDLIDKNDLSIICCAVNNCTRQLDFEVYYDCDIKLLRIDNAEAEKIYYNSIRYLFSYACHNLYPNLQIKISFSVSRSFMVKIINNNIRFDEEMMNNIEKEMRRIVNQSYDITRTKVPNAEAKVFYEENNMLDKIDILQYRTEKTVHLYRCNDYLNYMFGYLVINTAYLRIFQLRIYEKGILVSYPRASLGGQIPTFVEENTYQETLNKAYKWTKMIDSETISNINSHIKTEYDKVNFVHVCEARHNQDLVELATKIIEKIDDIKLIAIAGPSSSGKTTFSNRLRIQLMTQGVTPVKLSIDDYYLPRDRIKPDANGKIDLESINIIDIALFNEHLTKLINGEEVETPIFDFKTGTRLKGRIMKVLPGQPIIIEGIHALNDLLTPSINRKNKYKIYIAPHVQVNIDNLSPIRSTDLRLLRRIVRDYKYRGYDAENTLKLWESVRQGEYKWIYFNEEGVDYVYNSDLVYEVNVMKKHALPLLKQIPEDSPYYYQALSLIRFLKYYVDIEDDLVPCNSLLREFIGGSCFKDV